MASKNRVPREQRTKEKADGLFLAYQQMGEGRSLRGLAELCLMLGIKASEKSLNWYSQKFQWQRRLLDAQSKEAEKREQEAGKLVDEMNRQDAMIAQGMKALVVAGIRFHQDKIKKLVEKRQQEGLSTDQILDMSLKDITGMARTAQLIERLARGQVTSRTEIWVSVASTVVREFVIIFMAVNKIEDPEEREREYLRLGDEAMSRFYSETTKLQLKVGQDYSV